MPHLIAQADAIDHYCLANLASVESILIMFYGFTWNRSPPCLSAWESFTFILDLRR